MKFSVGDEVTVVYVPVGDGVPGWSEGLPNRFTGRVARSAFRGANLWVYVQPDAEFQGTFGGGWYCHPDWVQPQGGPW